LNPGDLRHSIASLWYREGVDEAIIAARLGHTIPVLESRYTWHFKTLDAADRRTVDEMNADARKPPRRTRRRRAKAAA
jgi:integrase